MAWLLEKSERKTFIFHEKYTNPTFLETPLKYESTAKEKRHVYFEVRELQRPTGSQPRPI